MKIKLYTQRDVELRAEIAKVAKERSAIGDKALEENRALTAEEKTKFAELGKEKATLEARLAENAELLASAKEAKEADRNWRGDTSDADAMAQAAAVKAAGVQVGHDNTANDPKRGFMDHREFIAKVVEVGRFNRLDVRLKPLQLQATAGSDEHGTYSDPSAAFLLPVAFSPDILAVQADVDPTAALTRKLPMTAAMVKINARVDKDHSSSVSGGLRVYRHSETRDATASRQVYQQLTFSAEDLMGLAFATENQITDSPGSFIAMVADGFRDEFAAKLLFEKIRGVGSAGQMTGALEAAAKIEVSKETGQKADTIVKENIDNMEARIWGPDSSDRVIYLANKSTVPQLAALKQDIGTGGAPVPYFTIDAQNRRRLNGRLIFFSEYCSALGDAGDIILVNWAEYIEGLFQPLQQAESIHVRFAANERALKFWLRNCGQCWWASALTPKYGSTLSPIVTLAARA